MCGRLEPRDGDFAVYQGRWNALSGTSFRTGRLYKQHGHLLGGSALHLSCGTLLVIGSCSPPPSSVTVAQIPFVDYPIVFDIRTRPRNVQTLTGSKDLQMVSITLRVLTRPDVRFLPTIYRELGTDFDDRVLPSIVTEVAKAVVANYNASELLTRRAGVAREIEEELRRRALTFNLVMEDVSITHLTISPAYEQAVEAKQVAQQESQRAKYIVDKALQEKKAIVIRAQGEAQSAKLIGNSIKNNPGFIQLRRIEAAKDISETVKTSPNKMFLSSDSLLLNVMNSDDKYVGMKK